MRALAAIVNEAALLVAEGVALRPGDVDVALVNGYGFARWLGGPVHWAQQQDPAVLAQACAQWVEISGPARSLADLRVLGVQTGDTA